METETEGYSTSDQSGMTIWRSWTRSAYDASGSGHLTNLFGNAISNIVPKVFKYTGFRSINYGFPQHYLWFNTSTCTSSRFKILGRSELMNLPYAIFARH